MVVVVVVCAFIVMELLCTAVNVSASGGLRTLDPPIDPYLTSRLLQNPGGATGHVVTTTASVQGAAARK